MKVPTFKLKEVEAPWTRLHRQFNDWAARKEAEAAARKAKEAQERAELEAERARASAVPIPVGVPSNAEEVAALRDRLAILENAWNAFHQARATMELLPAEREVMIENEMSKNRLQQVADLRAVVDGLQAEVAAFRAAGLKSGTDQDNLAPIRKDIHDLRGQIVALSKLSERGAAVAADAVATLRAQADALKLKVAAVEASDEATRAGLLALQEKQDADGANLDNLRKELEMEVVAGPK